MTQHTPGPWELKTFDECQTAVFAENMLIAIVSVGEGRPNGEANAKLIVVAPELLAVLQEGERVFRQPSPPADEIAWLSMARAAIATATGQEG